MTNDAEDTVQQHSSFDYALWSFNHDLARHQQNVRANRDVHNSLVVVAACGAIGLAAAYILLLWVKQGVMRPLTELAMVQQSALLHKMGFTKFTQLHVVTSLSVWFIP